MSQSSGAGVVASADDVQRSTTGRRSSAVAAALLTLVLAAGCGSPADGSVPRASSSVASAGPRSTAPEPSRSAATRAPTEPPLAPLAGTPDSQTYPFRPSTLLLPSGTRADVDPAGVDAAGALQVPSDPARVGWWTGGALVGEPFGSVVLAGHLDSSTQGLGVMVELLDLAVGDRVVVGDGARTQAYRVVSVDGVPKARLGPGFEAFRADVDHRLVLITCGGAYDHAAHSYPDNVVVVAVPTA